MSNSVFMTPLQDGQPMEWPVTKSTRRGCHGGMPSTFVQSTYKNYHHLRLKSSSTNIN